MLALATKGGLKPYPMLDNVIQSEVVDVASKQLVAAFGGTTSPTKALASMQAALKGAAVRPQGLDLQVAIEPAPAARAGATLAYAMAATPRAHRSRLTAERHRAGMLFSLPVLVLVGALLLVPDRADRLLQLHAVGRAHVDVDRHADVLAAAAEPRLPAGAQEQRAARARDPVRDRHPARASPTCSRAISPAGGSSARSSSCRPRCRGS